MTFTKSYKANYVSPWLIHWTARKGGEEEGLSNLNSIVQTRQLKLSYNRVYPLWWEETVKVNMVCFTDVPLQFSDEHCKRYGRFGIAFKKHNLLLKGAQPVFYVAPGCRERTKEIFDFLGDKARRKDMPEPVLKALAQHFCFIQEYSGRNIDDEEAYYYEREWRMTESMLAPENLWNQPDNPLYRVVQAGYPFHHGHMVARNGTSYFAFDQEDVAFLVVPASRTTGLVNNAGYEVRTYEEVVNLAVKDAG